MSLNLRFGSSTKPTYPFIREFLWRAASLVWAVLQAEEERDLELQSHSLCTPTTQREDERTDK